MDTRRIGAAVRRRVGQTPGMYDNVNPGIGGRNGRTKTIANVEMETDMGIISEHLASRRAEFESGRA